MSTGLEFEHRSSDSPLIEQVWRSRSTGATTMMSVARAHWDLVFWEDSKGLHAGVQGPETRASEAPVPQGASFLGVRFALGTRLSGLSPSSLVDRFTTLPIACGEVRIGPDQVRLPRYNDAEDFVDLLLRREARPGESARRRGGELPDASASLPSRGRHALSHRAADRACSRCRRPAPARSGACRRGAGVRLLRPAAPRAFRAPIHRQLRRRARSRVTHHDADVVAVQDEEGTRRVRST